MLMLLLQMKKLVIFKIINFVNYNYFFEYRELIFFICV